MIVYKYIFRQLNNINPSRQVQADLRELHRLIEHQQAVHFIRAADNCQRSLQPSAVADKVGMWRHFDRQQRPTGYQYQAHIRP